MTSKETTAYKIFVGGLDVETTEEDLTEYFSKFGKVVERLIKVDLKTKKSRGFGFIGFKSPDAVEKVLEHNEHKINGKKIDCKLAMSKEEAYSLNKNLKETCRKIYVSNIPRDITRDDLDNFFNQNGTVVEINLMFKKKETGFCYVIFRDEQDAVNLINKRLVEVKGYQLEIKKAIPKDAKDGPDDEERSRGYGLQYPAVSATSKYRHSFDTPMSYQAYYAQQQGHQYLQVPGAARYHGYDSYSNVQPMHGHAMSSHRTQEPVSPYSRPPVPPPNNISSQIPANYSPNKYQQYSAGFQHYPGPVDDTILLQKQPHRIRVMSEQQINTYKQFAGQGLSPIQIYQTQPRLHHSQARKQQYQNNPGLFTPDETRFVQDSNSLGDNNTYSNNLVDLPERNKTSPPVQAPSPSGAKQETDLNFYENEFTFKTQFPKSEDPQPQAGNDRTEPLGERSPLKKPDPSSTDRRSKKSAAIRKLEEEIRQTKEKLRMLQELLKKEYETVEEKGSDDELGPSEDDVQIQR
jgi:RNA recognition motif-containing protein